MRFVVILPFCLLIILVNLRHTTAEQCVCECCTSLGCTPTFAGNHELLWCSQSATCRQADCSSWHPDKCPSGSAAGQTRSLCPVARSASERLLPTLLIVIVFVPNNSRRSIQKIDLSIRNTTTTMIPYRRPTTMPQIRLDWLEKFGLIKTTSTSTMTPNFFKQRF